MAHLENGYSQIANETLEALARTLLSSNEYRLLMVVFRLTYGFGRKWARISMRTYGRMTGIDFRNCSKVEKRLRDRNIIKRTGERVRFQKYSEKWKNVGGNTDGLHKLEDLKTRDKTGKSGIVGGITDGDWTVGGIYDGIVGGTNDTLKKKETLIKTFGQEFVKHWEGVLGKAKRFGRDEFPKFEDPILEAVVKQIGWSTICNHRPRYEGRKLQERFLDLYAEEIIKRRSSE